MSDVEILVAREKPHVCFDAYTPGIERRKQRNRAPIVVVAVARDRQDIAQEVGRVPSQSFGACILGAPVRERVGNSVGKRAGEEEEEI